MDLVPSEEEEDAHQLIQRLAYRVATGMGLFTRGIWVSETDKGKTVFPLCTGMAGEAGYPAEPR